MLDFYCVWQLNSRRHHLIDCNCNLHNFLVPQLCTAIINRTSSDRIYLQPNRDYLVLDLFCISKKLSDFHSMRHHLIEYNCNLLNFSVPQLDTKVADGTSADRVDLQLGVRRVVWWGTAIGTKGTSTAVAPSPWSWLVVIILCDLIGLHRWKFSMEWQEWNYPHCQSKDICKQPQNNANNRNWWWLQCLVMKFSS